MFDSSPGAKIFSIQIYTCVQFLNMKLQSFNIIFTLSPIGYGEKSGELMPSVHFLTFTQESFKEDGRELRCEEGLAFETQRSTFAYFKRQSVIRFLAKFNLFS